MNAVGQPQSIVLLGGTSDIGLAIVAKYAAGGQLSRVVLAGRPGPALDGAVQQVQALGVADVRSSAFDGLDVARVPAAVGQTFAGGDVDIVVLAYGLLGDQAKAEADAAYAAEIATVNFSSAVAASTEAVIRLKAQGHGTLVVLSSVAGERARKSNFVYGSTKAGLDAFAYGLSDSVRGSGVQVVVVRPGFVHSKMTAGLPAAPLATTPEAVAEVTVDAVRAGKQLVWAPSPMRYVMSGLRHVPRSLFRKLPM